MADRCFYRGPAGAVVGPIQENTGSIFNRVVHREKGTNLHMSIEWWLIAGGLVFLYFQIARKHNYNTRDVSGFPEPYYDENLHEFTAEAVDAGKDMYEKILQLNADHPDQDIVKAYASLNEDFARCLTMYLAADRKPKSKDDKKQAIYWAAWSRELQKQEEVMQLANNLVPYESPT